MRGESRRSFCWKEVNGRPGVSPDWRSPQSHGHLDQMQLLPPVSPAAGAAANLSASTARRSFCWCQPLSCLNVTNFTRCNIAHRMHSCASGSIGATEKVSWDLAEGFSPVIVAIQIVYVICCSTHQPRTDRKAEACALQSGPTSSVPVCY